MTSDPQSPAQTASAKPWQKYSMFGVILVAYDRSISWLARLVWTLRAKITLSLLGCGYGPGLQVDGPLIVRATRPAAIQLGDNIGIKSRFRSNLVGLTNSTVFQCFREGRIRIGDNSGLSAAILSARASITIGRNVKVGGNARIYDHDFHAVDYQARRDPARDIAECRSAPVVIGDDVLIGANAIILKGVTIGDRSIVGAGAVVSLKNIPPDCVVAGNPARIVKQLAGPDSGRTV